MPTRKRDDDVKPSRSEEFTEKVSELGFDPWGAEEDDDGSHRRRDPLRRGPVAPTEDE
jgi:hypothetical protein